jgi:hypothetical protein
LLFNLLEVAPLLEGDVEQGAGITNRGGFAGHVLDCLKK